MSPTDRLSDAHRFLAVASLADELTTRCVYRMRAHQEAKRAEDEIARLVVEGVIPTPASATTERRA